jgi:hypothetical protein
MFRFLNFRFITLEMHRARFKADRHGRTMTTTSHSFADDNSSPSHARELQIADISTKTSPKSNKASLERAKSPTMGFVSIEIDVYSARKLFCCSNVERLHGN